MKLRNSTLLKKSATEQLQLEPDCLVADAHSCFPSLPVVSPVREVCQHWGGHAVLPPPLRLLCVPVQRHVPLYSWRHRDQNQVRRQRHTVYLSSSLFMFVALLSCFPDGVPCWTPTGSILVPNRTIFTATERHLILDIVLKASIQTRTADLQDFKC